MAQYPNQIYTPREKENRAGVVYDPNKKSVIFAEDIKALDDEVKAIEETLGPNLRNIFSNCAKGVIPVASGWDSVPDDLSKATDGDWTTPTGALSRTTSGWDVLGTITLDLGSPKNVLVGGRVGLYSSAFQILVYLSVSVDGNVWTSWSTTLGGADSRNEVLIDLISRLAYARYIQFIFIIEGAGTGYVKLYELSAIKMPS